MSVDNLLKTYQENFYTKFKDIDNNSLIIYLIIFICLLFISKFITISLTTIFIIGVSLVIIYVVYSKRSVDNLSEKKQTIIKNNMINPKSKYASDYPDIVNFLYKNKNLYYVNQDEFSAMIYSLDNFLQLYDEIINDKVIYCVENIEVATDFMRRSQNHLHSIIYSLNQNKIITNKFHDTINKYQKLMFGYLKRMTSKCNSKFNSKYINNASKEYKLYGPKPFNYYDTNNKDIRFDFY